MRSLVWWGFPGSDGRGTECTVKGSSRTRYCLRFLIHLARIGSGGDPVPLAVISTKTGISRRYLEQLAILLKSAGLIRGVSGRKGGYVLTRSSRDITVGDVVTAASGPILFADCIGTPTNCIRHEFCECRPIWVLVNREIENVLGRYSLADLTDERALNRLRSDAALLDGRVALEG